MALPAPPPKPITLAYLMTTPEIETGRLNRRISIQTKTTTATASGGKKTPVWNDVLTNVPAMKVHVVPNIMQEKYNAQALMATNIVAFQIRYREDVNLNELMQVTHGTSTYNVRSVAVPLDAKKSIVLLCEELEAKGSHAS